jgi:hypothetical protein
MSQSERPSGHQIDNQQLDQSRMAETVGDFLIKRIAEWGLRRIYGSMKDALKSIVPHKLFRQTTPGDWISIVNRVTDCLIELPKKKN